MRGRKKGVKKERRTEEERRQIKMISDSKGVYLMSENTMYTMYT